MAASPLAGNAGPAGPADRPGRGSSASTTPAPRTWTTPTSWSASARAGTAGRPAKGTFTEAHILAITQAICDFRRARGIDGPLYMGKDTHALSGPAQRTAVEVLAANGVARRIQRDDGFTPTPVISRAILAHNRAGTDHLADGIVVTPSHNPPGRRGVQVQPAQRRAGRHRCNKVDRGAGQRLLAAGQRRRPPDPVRGGAQGRDNPAGRTTSADYVDDLRNVIDMDAIRGARLRLGADPLGGSALPYWGPINAAYGLDIQVVNPQVDPTFAFMPVDHDGQIRMDCSSPYAMAGLVGLKDRFRVAFGNDPDADRHGIVIPSAGLMNPNHYLAVAIHYLLTHRPDWPAAAVVGKTLVSQRADRPGGGETRAAGVGGAGRVQVVLARAVRRVVLLRRGGERRGQLPAPRRDGLDDRQGRDSPGPAGRRDHGRHRQGPRRALPRVDGRPGQPVLHADRRPGRRGPEGPPAEARRPTTSGSPRWPASRSSPS